VTIPPLLVGSRQARGSLYGPTPRAFQNGLCGPETDRPYPGWTASTGLPRNARICERHNPFYNHFCTPAACDHWSRRAFYLTRLRTPSSGLRIEIMLNRLWGGGQIGHYLRRTYVRQSGREKAPSGEGAFVTFGGFTRFARIASLQPPPCGPRFPWPWKPSPKPARKASPLPIRQPLCTPQIGAGYRSRGH
jgi:hypothetical protein